MRSPLIFVRASIFCLEMIQINNALRETMALPPIFGNVLATDELNLLSLFYLKTMMN